MPSLRRIFILLAIIASEVLISSCAIIDLKDDLDTVRRDYGYLKGQASGTDVGSTILVGLYKRDAESLSIAAVRTVSPGETFYALLSEADYTLFAFSDSNGNFAYEPGEPAARVDNPDINWFRDMKGQDRVDPSSLRIQQIVLTSATVLERELDFSVTVLRDQSKVAQNFLRLVSWDDEAFSTENMKLGMWEPGKFQETVGFGFYVLKEFDPTKKSILLVHGINDTPRIFEELASAIPDDYQVLLYHYPSSFPLEYTSYALSETLDELVRRYQIPQLDVIAHSMGGLVSKGMLYQADEALRQKTRLFVSIASPFGGHAAAASGTKW